MQDRGDAAVQRYKALDDTQRDGAFRPHRRCASSSWNLRFLVAHRVSDTAALDMWSTRLPQLASKLTLFLRDAAGDAARADKLAQMTSTTAAQ